MRKHDCAFLGLLFALGAVVGLGIAVYAFVVWVNSGFTLEPKFPAGPLPGREAFLLFLVGLGVAGYCAFQAGVMFHTSQDDSAKRSREDEDDNA